MAEDSALPQQPSALTSEIDGTVWGYEDAYSICFTIPNFCRLLMSKRRHNFLPRLNGQPSHQLRFHADVSICGQTHVNSGILLRLTIQGSEGTPLYCTLFAPCSATRMIPIESGNCQASGNDFLFERFVDLEFLLENLASLLVDDRITIFLLVQLCGVRLKLGPTVSNDVGLRNSVLIITLEDINCTDFDVTLKVESLYFRCHTSVLRATCQRFADISNRLGLDGKQKNCIEVKGIKLPEFWDFIKYLYYKSAHFNNVRRAVQVYLLAQAFGIEMLEDICVSFFKNRLNMDNVIHLMISANMYGWEDLKKLFVDYFVSRCSYVDFFSESYRRRLAMHPELMREVKTMIANKHRRVVLQPEEEIEIEIVQIE